MHLPHELHVRLLQTDIVHLPLWLSYDCPVASETTANLWLISIKAGTVDPVRVHRYWAIFSSCKIVLHRCADKTTFKSVFTTLLWPQNYNKITCYFRGPWCCIDVIWQKFFTIAPKTSGPRQPYMTDDLSNIDIHSGLFITRCHFHRMGIYEGIISDKNNWNPFCFHKQP